MKVRKVSIRRFRAIEELEFEPQTRNVFVGQNNAGKSTILAALDLALHPGVGRPRAGPTELDYFDRDPAPGFEIEVVITELNDELLADAAEGLEGWHAERAAVIPDTDGEGVDACVRLRVRGTPDLDIVHEFAKPELAGARFGPRLRTRLGWFFDGQARDPSRQLAFYQGGVLDRLFGDANLEPALTLLKEAFAKGAEDLNADTAVAGVLDQLRLELEPLALDPSGPIDLEAGSVSNRELLQALRLAMPGPGTAAIPIARAGRGTQRLVLLATLLMLAKRDTSRPVIGGFEEPEEAVEPVRQVQAARMIRQLADQGGQVFVATHSPDIVRAFDSNDVVIVESSPAITVRRLALSGAGRHGYERRLDWPLLRGLFLRYPVVVEGVSDRVTFSVFWDALAASGRVPAAERIGLEPLSAEGITEMPMALRVLAEMGKRPIAWLELDRPLEADRVVVGGHARALVVYPDDPAANNLERLLSQVTPIASLARAMEAVAIDREHDWEAQRAHLFSRCTGVVSSRTAREAIRNATSLDEALAVAPEGEIRGLIALCLAAKTAPAPFEIKGGRNARIFAETVVAETGVPTPVARALLELGSWIDAGTGTQVRIDISLT